MTKSDMENMVQLYKDQSEFYKVQVSELREMNKELRDQNQRLQEGIMAVRSPEAYRDMVVDRTEPEPLVIDERKKMIGEIQTRYLTEMEGDLFKSADDMVEILAPALFKKESKSIHGNSES